MNEKVSIALCTYNGAEFLPAQLASFAAQTRLPDELVVCDDGSTDETLAILENFARTATFQVKINRNEQNLGTVKNFEKAIVLATGDLIFLSDQDDVWAANKIARFGEEFAARPDVSMIFSNAELTDERLAPLNNDLFDVYFPFRREIKSTDDFFEKLLNYSIVTGATMAFRASLRDLFLPIPPDLPLTIHDGWIALVAAANGEVYFTEEKLIKYRQHARQQIGVGKTERSKEDFAASVRLHQQNIERLEKLKVLLETSPAFAKKKSSAHRVAELVEETRETVRHYEMRGALQKNKFKRFAPIARELLSKRYHRFSKGWRSAAKDLLKK